MTEQELEMVLSSFIVEEVTLPPVVASKFVPLDWVVLEGTSYCGYYDGRKAEYWRQMPDGTIKEGWSDKENEDGLQRQEEAAEETKG